MSKHIFNGVEISGAAIDVLYKLFFYGPQEDGDLPSKSGMSELIGLAWAFQDYNVVGESPNSLSVTGLKVARQYYREEHNLLRFLKEKNDSIEGLQLWVDKNDPDEIVQSYDTNSLQSAVMNMKQDILTLKAMLSAEEKKDVNEYFSAEDLSIYTYLSVNPGRIHKSNDGVAVLHKPTGYEARSHSERGQHANRQKALEELKGYLELIKYKPPVEPYAFATPYAQAWVNDGVVSLVMYSKPPFDLKPPPHVSKVINLYADNRNSVTDQFAKVGMTTFSAGNSYQDVINAAYANHKRSS